MRASRNGADVASRQDSPSKEIAERLTACLSVSPQEHQVFIRFARGESSTVQPSPLPPQIKPVPWPQPQSVHPNLRAPSTALIGREREVAGVCDLLRRPHVRLVTLIRAGGIGKTRLGLEVASDLVDDFEDDFCLVRLASIRDPDLVAYAIAQALEIKRQRSKDGVRPNSYTSRGMR